MVFCSISFSKTDVFVSERDLVTSKKYILVIAVFITLRWVNPAQLAEPILLTSNLMMEGTLAKPASG